jgi:hypothetical protein
MQYVGIVLRRTGNTNNVATGCGELGNLLKSSIDVGSWSCGHRLHGDWSIATDCNFANHDLARLASWR